MIRKCTLIASTTLVLLAGCGGGGDINLQPTNIDNSVDNSTSTTGGGGDNPCANYLDTASNTTIRGTFDGTNCTYDSSFVGQSNPLTSDLTIPFISGVHIFQDSLFVGENVDTGVAPAGGSGPTLTIAAGNTLAFLDSADYVLINRGSTINAIGSPTAPITFTAFSDAVTGTAGPEDVSLWGGMQINGNGITNNCTDAERTGDACHVVTEGQPSNYGGSANDESSGTLQYVVVKHTGFEVAPGDELNGITWNTVGSGTTVDHIESYSTFDDGFEFFGGAVNVSQFVGLYVRDDTIDYSDGWLGGFTQALVIHPLTNGNRCIEGDNIGESRANNGETLDTAPVTSPTISGLTCLPSVFDESQGATHGDSEGITLRRGPQSRFVNNLMYSGYGELANAQGSNECFELDDGATRDFAQNGSTTMSQSVIACSEPTKDDLGNGDSIRSWVLGTGDVTATDYTAFNVNNVIIDDPNNANVSVLEMASFFSLPVDGDGNTVITIADGTNVTITGQLGAVTRADDWTGTWAFGLKAANRAQPLYFE